MNRDKFPEMRAELRSREAESKAIRKNIQNSSGMTRWGYWQEKREFGQQTRWVLLAYAFLRKMPYAACESKCELAPFTGAIQKVLARHGREVSVDEIKSWVAPAQETAVAA